MDGDFWDDMQEAFVGRNPSLDAYLAGGQKATSMSLLTDKSREAHALPLPQPAGTRVRFIANLGSVLTYPDVPNEGIEGTVVTVKTGGGLATAQDGRAFVLWDDGKFRTIMAEHLRFARSGRKMATTVRMRVADVMDLTAFFEPTARQDELVHKATQDLWALKKSDDGYVIERLFTDTGKPLKV